jgi:CHAT domain-containing protein
MRFLLTLGCVFCFIFRSGALCPAPENLYASFQKINRNKLDPQLQQKELVSWMTQWERCYPKADSVYIDALLLSGMYYYKESQIENAIQIHEKIINIYKENKGLRLKLSNLAKAYYRLGVFYGKIQKLNESTDALQQTIHVSGNNTGLKLWVNQAHLYLIYNYYVQGDYQRALQHAYAGEVLSTELKDDIVLSKVLQQKAQVLHMLKQFPEALTAIDKAIPLIENTSHQQNSTSSQYMLRGNILRDLNKNKEALESLRKAYSIAQKNQEVYISDFPMAIGYFFQTIQEYELALKHYHEALNTDTGSHNKCLIFNNIANIYKHQKKFPEALEYVQEGIYTIIPELKDTSKVLLPPARTIRTLQQKDFLLGLIRDKAEIWLEYAKNQKNNQSFLERSLNTYMLADSMIDFMRWEHTGNSSKLYWREKTYEMYEQAIEASYWLNDPVKALYFFEKSRAVLLNDEINTLGAGQQLSPEDQQTERSLRQQITELQFQLANEKKQSAEYVNLMDQLLKAEELQKVFIKSLETRSPAYYSYRYNNQVPSLEDIRDRLLKPMGNNAVLITFFAGKSSMYGIGIKNSGTQFLEFDKMQYDSLVRKLSNFLPSKERQNKAFKEYLKTSAALYQLVFEPFKLSENSRIIISINSDFFPFEALNKSENNRNYLGQEHAISYAYSAGILMKNLMFGHQPDNRKSFLGIAPVEFSGITEQPSLPGSDVVVKTIKSYFPSSEILTHKNATRKAFLRQAPQYHMVQLLTHAIADSTADEPTLYFSDSTLLLSEIGKSGSFNTRLMVLSACQTGIGKNQAGEGVYSLARGFASAGIPSVMTTLWSVENKQVYGLTQLFFEYVRQGEPLDLALQKARTQWLEESSGTDQLPYSWAGIVLVGQTDPIHTDSRVLWWAAGFILCLAMLVIVALLKRR